MQQQPMQQQYQQMYQTAVPLGALQDASAPVDCPVCRHRALTILEKVSGNTVQYVRLFYCLSLPCPCNSVSCKSNMRVNKKKRMLTSDSRVLQSVGRAGMFRPLSRLRALPNAQSQRCETQMRTLRGVTRRVAQERADGGVAACLRGEDPRREMVMEYVTQFSFFSERKRGRCHLAVKPMQTLAV